MRSSFAGRLVGEHGGALDRSLGETDRLADARVVDQVAEVLAQDLVRLARVRQALVVHRRHDADDLDARVQVLAHHRERVLELHEPAQRQVLGLHRDDHAGRRDERVDRQQPERRRRIDQDVVVAILDRSQRLFERALAADLARQRHVGAGKVDRRTAMSASRVTITCSIGSRWTSTSNIDFSIVSGFRPCDIVRLPCGSRSTSSTR